jgi:hypothetical protein
LGFSEAKQKILAPASPHCLAVARRASPFFFNRRCAIHLYPFLDQKAAAHSPTLIREISTQVPESSPFKGFIRSQRKRCALDPTFRHKATQHIFHGFGA